MKVSLSRSASQPTSGLSHKLSVSEGTLKTRDWKRRDWKTRHRVARGGKRGTWKRRTLKVCKALQFSKAKATEQRSRQFTAAWTHPQTRTATIRLMILTPAQTPSSRPLPPQPLTATKWNVRVVVVPSAAQTFRWSCVFFYFYVTLCTVIGDFLHWTTWSFSDMLCRTCYSGFLQVRENWKKSGNLLGQGKSGKTLQFEDSTGKVRENESTC